MRSTVLVGPRCCGKTETGQALAGMFGVPFIDIDSIFKQRYGTVEDFLKTQTWEDFRKIETLLIGQTCNLYQGVQIVLAPGGGAVAHDKGEQYRQTNVNLLRTLGRVSYLIPSTDPAYNAKVLLARQPVDKMRPPLTPEQKGTELEQKIAELTQRDPLYKASSDEIIYTDGMSVRDVATGIFISSMMHDPIQRRILAGMIPGMPSS